MERPSLYWDRSLVTQGVGTLAVIPLEIFQTQYQSLQWSHNERDGVSNHQRLDCLLDILFGCRSKKTSKICVTCLCEGSSPVTGEFPAQRASNAENVFIWWRHHVRCKCFILEYIEPISIYHTIYKRCLHSPHRSLWSCFQDEWIICAAYL